MSTRLPISRRRFLVGAGVAGALAELAPATLLAEGTPVTERNVPFRVGPATASALPVPVVSFHQDAPYLDFSGQGVPYLPPEGLRAGEALARLTETELHTLSFI